MGTIVGISGLPGKMAMLLGDRIGVEEGIDLLPWALTGPEIMDESVQLGDLSV